MLKRILYTGPLLLLACCLHGQQLRRHALKCDLTAFLKGYSAAYEYRLHPKTSLELQGYFEKHPDAGPDIFNGEWVAYYAERKIDTLHEYFNTVLGSSGWEYVNERRPLPPANSFVPVSTLQLSLGMRFIFEKRKSPWRIFLQPGCATTRHRFYEITDKVLVLENVEKIWEEGVYPNEYRIKRRNVSYRQTRTMLLKNAWLIGLRYDVGVARKFGNHFFLEARLNTGAHLWLPYEEPAPPPAARRFWAKPALLAGWTF